MRRVPKPFNSIWKGSFFPPQPMLLRKTGHSHVESKFVTVPHTIYPNYLNGSYTWSYNTLAREHGVKSLWPCIRPWFLTYDTRDKQQRKGKLELMQIKTYSKGIIKKLKRQPAYLQIIYPRMVFFPGCMKNSYDSIKR